MRPQSSRHIRRPRRCVFCSEAWSLRPWECKECAAEPFFFWAVSLNKSGNLGWKKALKSANQVFNMVSGSSEACFDCLGWCGWLAACSEAHSKPDQPGHHWPIVHTHTRTHAHTLSVQQDVPHAEVKYAWVLSMRIFCMLLKESERERKRERLQENTERGINQYPEWSQVVCMCLFLLMCWLTAHTHTPTHARTHPIHPSLCVFARW